MFFKNLFLSTNNPIHMAIHIGGSVQNSSTSSHNKILFLKKSVHTIHHHIFI
nr:MAG TPA: hypothetical protein [Caudoviricetes sp.]